MYHAAVVETVIAVGQGLGLAAAAGLISAAPVAIGATAATQDLLEDPASFASKRVARRRRLGGGRRSSWSPTRCGRAPGAGGRLVRRVIAGGIAFELAAGGVIPYAGLAIGAVVAAGVGLAHAAGAVGRGQGGR